MHNLYVLSKYLLNLFGRHCAVKKMDAKELAIQYAIDDLMTGVHKSQRKAAQAHGVARSTLQERLNGRQCHAVAHQDQQRLTPEQEDFMADWILSEHSSTRSPSRHRVRETATWILGMNGDYRPLGKLWVSNFVARHPHVTHALSRSAETFKIATTGRASVRDLLELSRCTRVELGLSYRDLLGISEAKVARKVRTKDQTVAAYFGSVSLHGVRIGSA